MFLKHQVTMNSIKQKYSKLISNMIVFATFKNKKINILKTLLIRFYIII